MELKIRIKETVDERRQLTFEEECMICIMHHTHKDTIPHEMYVECMDHMNYIGYVYSSYDPQEHSALFHKEITRDATPEEIEAWYYMMCHRTGLNNYINGTYIYKIRDIFSKKEIILELI